MTALMALVVLLAVAWSHLKLLIVLFHPVFIEIKKLFWLFSNLHLKIGTF
jgi:hypothetical protein